MRIPDEATLITVTQDYLATGRFDSAAMARFSETFHRFYIMPRPLMCAFRFQS